MTDGKGFEHIREITPTVEKEITRRAELRPRLEAELGRRLTDDEFIALAETTGVRL